MNLYRTATGEWVGTQADAKRDGHGWFAVEVPVDKPGLMAWLNDNCRAAPAAPTIPADLDVAQPVVVERKIFHVDHDTKALSPGAKLIEVETFIQSADHRTVTGLFENVMLRSRELLKGIG